MTWYRSLSRAVGILPDSHYWWDTLGPVDRISPWVEAEATQNKPLEG